MSDLTHVRGVLHGSNKVLFGTHTHTHIQMKVDVLLNACYWMRVIECVLFDGCCYDKRLEWTMTVLI